MAKLIEMPFVEGADSHGLRNIYLVGVHVDATWQIRLNDVLW